MQDATQEDCARLTAMFADSVNSWVQSRCLFAGENRAGRRLPQQPPN